MFSSSVARASWSILRRIMKIVAMVHWGLAMFQIGGEALYASSYSVLTTILGGRHFYLHFYSLKFRV